MGEAFMRRRLGGEVEWKKYSATKKTEGRYQQSSTFVGDSWSSSYNSISIGSGYEWSDDSGWYLTGRDSTNAENAVGYYHDGSMGGHYVIVDITGYDASTGTLSGEVVADCYYETTGYYYVKGTKAYGSVTAKKGTYPGPGSVFDGSPAEGWCVMLESGTYYYYEMAQ